MLNKQSTRGRLPLNNRGIMTFEIVTIEGTVRGTIASNQSTEDWDTGNTRLAYH